MGKQVIIIAAAAVFAAVGGAPEGWYLAESMPGAYDTGVDRGVIFNMLPSFFLKSKETAARSPTYSQPFSATLLQAFGAVRFVGKRIRFSAWVRTQNVADSAGLWMRIEDNSASRSQSRILSFDNMQDRPLRGTMGWQKAEVVLDVPDGATGIYFGLLVMGTGAVWLNNCQIEEVGADVPTTGKFQKQTRTAPVNLGFEQ